MVGWLWVMNEEGSGSTWRGWGEMWEMKVGISGTNLGLESGNPEMRIKYVTAWWESSLTW